MASSRTVLNSHMEDNWRADFHVSTGMSLYLNGTDLSIVIQRLESLFVADKCSNAQRI